MGEKESSLNFLRNSLEKGFTRFAHIRNDDDMNVIRDMPEYKNIMSEYETKYNEEQQKKRDKDSQTGKKQEYVTEIPFTWDGGNCYVKCKINDLPMQFVFDTGASDVSMSMVEASFMMKNGYLSKSDVVGSTKFSDALGNVSEGTIIVLKKVQFGDVELDNVRASVVRNQKAPLLLGQTVLSRAGKIEIDNQKKVIKVTYFK
jgi:clan AA aspartic protease (TIGR02281 family)